MMEQHPIPQDITGFKFKLVGDMTLKQFAYLAAGLVVAWIMYSTPWYPFIRLPLAALTALLGVAFAFVPIEDRPLDIWVVNFFRAIYRPTFLIWQKTATYDFESPLLSTTAQPQLPHVPQLWPFPKPASPISTPPPSAPKVDPQSDEPKKQDATPPTPPVQPFSVDQLEKLREEKLNQLEEEKQRREEMRPPDYSSRRNVPATPPVLDVETLEKMRIQAKDQEKTNEMTRAVEEHQTKLDELLKQKTELTTQMGQLQSQIAKLSTEQRSGLEQKLGDLSVAHRELSPKITEVQKTIDNLTGIKTPPKPQVKVVAKQAVRPTATISLSELPNVISGLVKGNTGEPVVSAIVIIKDKIGDPIRALKTNKIGQFITNTPLENGTYYLELEKEGFKFNTLEISLAGQVLPILDIAGEPA